MIALAVAFFFYMEAALMPKSNDPAAMMRTVGQVSGVVGGLGLVIVLFGALRRRR